MWEARDVAPCRRYAYNYSPDELAEWVPKIPARRISRDGRDQQMSPYVTALPLSQRPYRRVSTQNAECETQHIWPSYGRARLARIGPDDTKIAAG